MPYCPSCGEGIEEKHRFCGQCSYKLRDDLPPLSQTHKGFLSPDVIHALIETESEIGDRDDAEDIINQLEEDLQHMLVDLGFVLRKIGVFSFGAVLSGDTDSEALSDKQVAETKGVFALAAYADSTWGENLDEIIETGYDLAEGDEASPKSTSSSNSTS